MNQGKHGIVGIEMLFMYLRIYLTFHKSILSLVSTLFILRPYFLTHLKVMSQMLLPEMVL